MSKTHSKTFVDLALAGEALPGDIDGFIEEWHENPREHRSLPEFLGMEDHEYALWVENPNALSLILQRRQHGLSFQ